MPASLDPEVRNLLALHLVPGLGPKLTAALLERFGSAAAVLQLRPDQLHEVPHIGPQIAEKLASAMRSVKVDAELELMNRHDVSVLALGKPGYPEALANLPAPPPLLYVRGSLTAADRRAIALVGSRHGTTYGLRVAERLAAGLARAGVTVVSGLARGIDGAAHRASLQAGGRTIAVLAGGLSKIYPPEHTDLAKEVAAAGALVTEATMTQEPMAGMFPARNRIISALSCGVVIVEAAERSGALITARHAADQGIPVFAVPGPVDSPTSAGSLNLVRQGATLIRGVEDILEALDGIAPAPQPEATLPVKPPPLLEGNELRIWQCLEEKVRHIDEMVQQLELQVSAVTHSLVMLEMKKLVRRLPGNRYERW